MALPHPTLHSLQDAERNFDAIERRQPQLVTTLPANPFDGQVIDFLADATNGVVWRFRYRAGSASSFKWEFVGGSALRATVGTNVDETTASGSYVDLATTGPAITVPLAGDYDATWWASGSWNGYVSLAPGPSDDQAMIATTGYFTGSMEWRRTGLSVNTQLKVQYRANSGTGSWRLRRLHVVPVRVG